MNCAAVERCVDAVVDQEVDPSTGIAVEAHLASCASCRERVEFARWMKQRIGEVGRLSAPEALRGRVEQALASESGAPGAPRLSNVESSWRATAAMAAMALMVFGIGGALQLKGPHVAARFAPLFEDVVRAHTRSYPAEVARRDLVPTYFADKVDFTAQPVDFGDPSVRFVGARHAQVGGRHAVTFQYEAGGRRMTVVAFRPPPHAFDGGEIAPGSDGRDVRLVRVGTHLVPVVEQGGVVYAVVGAPPEDGVRLAGQASVH